MSKVKTTPWGLVFGHPTVFRQTVTVGDDRERVQLVFEPNEWLDLTAQEVEGVQPFIDSGLIVPWDEDWKNRRSRSAAGRSDPNREAELGKQIDDLKLDVADLEEQVALLIQQVTDLGGEPVVEVADGTAEPTDKKGAKRGKAHKPVAVGAT